MHTLTMKMNWCENVTHSNPIFPSISRWMGFSSRLYERWGTLSQWKIPENKATLSHTMKCSTKMPQFRLLFFCSFGSRFNSRLSYCSKQSIDRMKYGLCNQKHCALSVELLLFIDGQLDCPFFVFRLLFLWLIDYFIDLQISRDIFSVRSSSVGSNDNSGTRFLLSNNWNWITIDDGVFF